MLNTFIIVFLGSIVTAILFYLLDKQIGWKQAFFIFCICFIVYWVVIIILSLIFVTLCVLFAPAL